MFSRNFVATVLLVHALLPSSSSATAPLSGVTKVAVGARHVCAVMESGAVKCWGTNNHGQLGDGTTTDRNGPVDVLGLSADVIEIAAGGDHTCALTNQNDLFCWGHGRDGYLVGDGVLGDRLVASRVPIQLPSVKTLSAGRYSDCLVTVAGGVKCWGYGYVGLGATKPADVAGLTAGVIQVGLGWDHACAVLDTGKVSCWGLNYNGQLGDGTDMKSPTPVAATQFAGQVVSIALGDLATCTSMRDGTVWCVGVSGTGDFRSKQIGGLTDAVRVVGSTAYHWCATTKSGSVKCWGSNTYGQLGDGSTVMRFDSAADVVNLAEGVRDLALGGGSGSDGYYSHTCAATNSGGVRCWGKDFTGSDRRAMPVDVVGLGQAAVEVAAGWFHSCARTMAGAVKCWGNNDSGQLGNGNTVANFSAVDVVGLSAGVTSIATAGAQQAITGLVSGHSCAIKSAQAMCWGNNDWGLFGDGSRTSRLLPSIAFASISLPFSIQVGMSNVFVEASNGKLLCAGWGQLCGTASSTTVPTPTDIQTIAAGAKSVSARFQHACAVTPVGQAVCWGKNAYGQLGDGTTIAQLTPTVVTALGSDVAAIATGLYQTCALTKTGNVKCWGANDLGQLGDGTTKARSLPADVIGLGGGNKVLRVGGAHACVVAGDGAVKCWGHNDFGQLGDGTAASRLQPVEVAGLKGLVAGLDVGLHHNCAVLAQGGVKCWGANEYGQLGDGTAGITTVAKAVPSAATKLVIEYYNAKLDHYFVTSNGEEAAKLDEAIDIKGWVRTGAAFASWGQPNGGTSPVCRYYIPPAAGDSHFFGRGSDECTRTGERHPDFVLEDPAFMHMMLPTDGQCPPGTVNVYRVFSNRADANHRYTTDRVVRDQMVVKGWLAEGDGADMVVMCGAD
jgi:alpha-tubulin suppressor-like RCC1 family protein